jgi:hypothetical protein
MSFANSLQGAAMILGFYRIVKSCRKIGEASMTVVQYPEALDIRLETGPIYLEDEIGSLRARVVSARSAIDYFYHAG